MRIAPHFLLPVLLALTAGGGGGGCAHKTPKKAADPSETTDGATPKPAPSERVPNLIGRIVMVNETDRFVLIDTGNLAAPAAGTALKSFRDGLESGVVAVGAIHRHPFVVADISAGAPQKGDQVFQ